MHKPCSWLSCLLTVFQHRGSLWPKFSPVQSKQPFKPSSWYLTEAAPPFGQGAKLEFKAQNSKCYIAKVFYLKKPNLPKIQPPKNPKWKNTHTSNLRPEYWPTVRRSTGGQTREREENKSRNWVSVFVVQSVFTESANFELAHSTPALAPTAATSTVSGKWLRHISGEQHGSSASKGQSRYTHVSDTCARVAVPAAQHMMCQLLYIEWVRKRLIKQKRYSSACNISAFLSSFTLEKKNYTVLRKGLLWMEIETCTEGQRKIVQCTKYRPVPDTSYQYFIVRRTVYIILI